MKKEKQELKIAMFNQATIFLEDAGEFFPYGTIVKSNGDIVPVGIYNDKEYLPSNEVIEILKRNLYSDITNKKAVLVGIGVDVRINIENKEGKVEKRDALMLNISVDGVNWTEEFYPYIINIKGKTKTVLWR